MSTIARVGSEALSELRTDLTNLSNTLREIYDLMNADMRNVNADWQDNKYQEFVQGYEPQIRKCEEIATRYTQWCTQVLDPTIENVVAVEMTDVSGSSIGGGGAVGTEASVGTDMGSPSADIGSDKFSGFNL